MGARLAWLGLTPEPERELPVAVAMLRARHGAPSAALSAGTAADVAPWITAESRRIEALIMRGTQRSWLRYLGDVTGLITDASAASDADDAALILQAAEAVLEHHRMLIGLPGDGYQRVAADREALTVIVTRLRAAAS